MASILDLVDQIIGNILGNNIYTDTSRYSSVIRSPLRGQLPDHAHNPSTVVFPYTNEPRDVFPVIQGRTHDAQSDYTNQQGQIIESKRAEIYRPNSPPPSIQSLADFHEQVENGADLSKGAAYRNREDIYKDPGQIQSNIAGTEISRPTLGDQKSIQGLPPAPPLHGDSVDPSYFPPQGDTTQNLYHDSNVPFDGKYAILSQRPVPSNFRTLDITATAHWMRNIAREFGMGDMIKQAAGLAGVDLGDLGGHAGDGDLGNTIERIVKGANFVGTQFLLASLRPSDPQVGGPLNAIWNPLSIGAAIPGLSPNFMTQIVLNPGYKYTAELPEDRLLSMRAGRYIESRPIEQINQRRFPNNGFLGSMAKSGKAEPDTLESPGLRVPFSIEEILDGGPVTEAVRLLGEHTNIYTPESPYNITNAVMPLDRLEGHYDERISDNTTPEIIKLNRLFSGRNTPGGLQTSYEDARTWVAVPKSHRTTGVKSISDLPDLKNAASKGDTKDNAWLTDQEIADSNTYLPFMFLDLRDTIPEFLYFRAFLKDFSENFTPDWQLERFYGRVDHVPTYIGTTRNIEITFDVVAFKPEDLSVIYSKLEKLQSLVYPHYDSLGFMNSGPIIRMRVGDLFAGGAGEGKTQGLPGYITSMIWSFPDGIWNIKEGFKVPRLINVSLSFTVLHDGNPGTYPYESADIAPDGGVEPSGKKTFGVAKFTPQDNGVNNVKVDLAEARRIFKNVKNNTGDN